MPFPDNSSVSKANAPDRADITKPTAPEILTSYPGGKRMILRQSSDHLWIAWLDGIEIGKTERSGDAWLASTGSSSQSFGHPRAAARWIAATHAEEGS